MKEVCHLHFGRDEIIHKLKQFHKGHSLRWVQLQQGTEQCVHFLLKRPDKEGEGGGTCFGCEMSVHSTYMYKNMPGRSILHSYALGYRSDVCPPTPIEKPSYIYEISISWSLGHVLLTLVARTRKWLENEALVHYVLLIQFYHSSHINQRHRQYSNLCNSHGNLSIGTYTLSRNLLACHGNFGPGEFRSGDQNSWKIGPLEENFGPCVE